MQLTFGYRYDNLAPHYLTFHVSVGVYLASIMLI
jgi:hypothetical protein